MGRNYRGDIILIYNLLKLLLHGFGQSVNKKKFNELLIYSYTVSYRCRCNIAGFDCFHDNIHQVLGDGDQGAGILHLNNNTTDSSVY